jgi:hypothetical protein
MKERSYFITYTVRGGGGIEISAKNKLEAESLFWDEDYLIESANLSKGDIEIVEMERDDGVIFESYENEIDLQNNV